MKGLLNLLAKANLVELSDEEKAEAGVQNSAMVETDQPAVTSEAPEQVSLENLPETEGGITENRPLEEVYAAAGLPEPSFSAEKLLRLLDGLRTMDVATRKAAVIAMDAADENWQMADCIEDANRKIAALSSYKQYLAAQLQEEEKHSVSKIDEIRAGLENTSNEIRKQISELEQLLEREITKSAQQTTAIEAGVRAARETAGRETRRIESEIERLREIPAQFMVENSAQ